MAIITANPQPSMIELIFPPLIWAGGLIVVCGTRLWTFSPTSQINDEALTQVTEDPDGSSLS
ncbi:MAG: hypothetical protein ACRD6W_07785 [Nitrososphaerales archaeon]